MPPNKKILVVDDESGIVVLCQHLLELASYQVLTATEPQTALEIAGRESIDLLLTDIRLPGMDGFELARRIKLLHPEIAVVVMTGFRTVETAIRALRSGVDGLVIKPYELGSELLDIVRQAYERNQERQSSVSIQALQPAVRIGSVSLLDTASQPLDKFLLPSLQELLKAAHCAIYQYQQRPVDPAFSVSAGNIPNSDDPFWQTEVVQKITESEPLSRAVFDAGMESPLKEVMEQMQWGSLALLNIKRRKERFLFLAARDVSAAKFLRIDLDLLTMFARQAAALIENTRLFNNMANIAQRVERTDGILQRAGRMELLEALMPDLIREINLPLQAVKNSMYLAGRGGSVSSERVQEHLSMAQKELYRLEQVMQSILALTQPLDQESGSVDIEALITKALDVLKYRLKDEEIQVKLAVNRPLPPVFGVRDQMELVFFNLVLNSLDAMKGMAADKSLWIDTGPGPGGVLIRIEDSGPGFVPGSGAHIFKPFYTTNPNGTGIGLAVSKRIIENQGGQLTTAQPTRGQGACLLVTLPAAAE